MDGRAYLAARARLLHPADACRHHRLQLLCAEVWRYRYAPAISPRAFLRGGGAGVRLLRRVLLGPGVGSFWTIALILGLGMNLLTATGYTKVLNFASNIVSFAVFAIGANVLFTVGLCMGAGEIIGARIGSGLSVFKRARGSSARCSLQW